MTTTLRASANALGAAMSKQRIANAPDRARQIEYLNDYRVRAEGAMCEAFLMRDLFNPNGSEYEKKLTDSGGEALSVLFDRIANLLCEAANLAGIDAAELHEAIQGGSRHA